jgi:hypothetical protein
MRVDVFSQGSRDIPEQPSIDELRREFAARGLEGWLWPWLTRVLMASVFGQIKPRYAAETYSPSGAWDTEGVWDLVQEFIMERGVNGEAIEAALNLADLPAGVKRYLETALLNYTISDRRRDTASNIYRRLNDVLATHAQLRPLAGIGMRAAYGLDDWSHDPPEVVDAAAIRGAERYVPADVEMVEYSTGTRLSPGLASHDLGRIAHALVVGTGALWRADQIMLVLEERFVLDGDDPDEPTGGHEELTRVATTTQVLDRLVAEELARRVLTGLMDSQRTLLRLMIEDPSLGVRALAERLGVSKSQVNKLQHRIAAAFSEVPVAGSEEQEQVWQVIGELLRDPDSPPADGSGAF